MRLRDILKRRQAALRNASPKSRDRLRHLVRVAKKAIEIKQGKRAA
ncbi:hypothetical protein [Bradyrhizobium sp. LA2.1]